MKLRETSRIVIDLVLCSTFIVAMFFLIISSDLTVGASYGNTLETTVALFAGSLGLLLFIWFIDICIWVKRSAKAHSPVQFRLTGASASRWVLTFLTCRSDAKLSDFSLTNVTEVRRRLSKRCQGVSYSLSVMFWNVGWAILWTCSTPWWRRDTYNDNWDFSNVHSLFTLFQSVFLVGATIQFVLKVIRQQHIIELIFSIEFLVELITLAPAAVFVSKTNLSHFDGREYLQAIGWLRWLRTFVFIRVVSNVAMWRGSKTKARMVQLALGIVILLIAFASAMFTTQGISPAADPNWAELWTWLYFAVVTMSTVGYGDISPDTWVQQLYTVIFIVAVLAWIPAELNSVLDAYFDSKRQVGSLPSKYDRHKFILICGAVEPKQLSGIINEIANSHSVTYVSKIVLLTQRKQLDFEDQIALAQQAQIQICIKYGDFGMGGDIGEAEKCRPKDARAVFLLTNPLSTQWQQEDRQCLTRLLALKALKCNLNRVAIQCASDPNLPYIALNYGVSSCYLFTALKLQLFALTIDGVPGVIPLFANLITSLTPMLPDHKRQEALPRCEKEFVLGARRQLYSFIPPECFHRLRFDKLAAALYKSFDAILIGIGEMSRSPATPKHSGIRRTCWLNPGVGYCIEPTDECFIISDNPKTRTRIQELHSLPSSWSRLFEATGSPEPSSPVHKDEQRKRLSRRLSSMLPPSSASHVPIQLPTTAFGGASPMGDIDEDSGPLVVELQVESYEEALEKAWEQPKRPFILICGRPREFHSLLTALKNTQRWNVLVLTTDFSRLKSVGQFSPFVAFVQGRAVNAVNLLRAGVLHASKHIIFPGALDFEMDETDPQIGDDRNCTIVKMMIQDLLKADTQSQRIARETKTLTSLVSGSPSEDAILLDVHFAETVTYVDEMRHIAPMAEAAATVAAKQTESFSPEFESGLIASCSQADLLLSPTYASGWVFTDSLLHGIAMRQPFVSPTHVHPHVYFALLGLSPRPELIDDSDDQPNLDETSVRLVSHPSVRRMSEVDDDVSQLETQLNTNSSITNFSEVFNSFLKERNQLAIGIYRKLKPDTPPYVITAPPFDFTLEPSDMFFVIPPGVPCWDV